MAISAESNFITEFDDMVKLAYQGKGKLKPTVRVKGNVSGSTCTFNTYGEGIMTEFNRGNDVVAVNADQNHVSCTIVDYTYDEYVFMVDINKIAYDETMEIVQSAGLATGRREDQLIINALSTAIADGDFPAGNILQASSSVNQALMTVANLRSIMKIFDDNEIDEADRTLLLAPQQINDLLSTTQVTSSDYNTVRTLVSGQVKTFLGFNIIKMGNRAEGGIPSQTITGVNYTAFAWHKKAVGLAIGIDKRTDIDWVPEKKGHLISVTYSAGAVAIDFEGIVSLQTGTAAA